MLQKSLGIIFALSMGLLSAGTPASAETDAGVPSWLPQPGPGEDALVVRRNAVMNKLAEARNNRVTIVKFDDGIDAKCPTLTSLFLSTGNTLELLTPNFSLGDAARTTIYFEGVPEEKSADIIVQNSACRYVLTVKRYDRNGEVEEQIQVKNLPKTDRDWIFARPMRDQGEKIGFTEKVMPFVNPSKMLDFTGIVFFAPTTFTVYLAGVEKDLTIASESNFLTRSYKVEIKNAGAVLRIAIRKELYSNGDWVSAFGK